MESVEVSAKSVDEAIDIALGDLGLKRSQVSIEILTPGKPGIFGLGGEPARIRVTALEEGTARPMLEEEAEEEPYEEEEEEEEEAPRWEERPRREREEEEPPRAERGEPIEVKGLDSEEVQTAVEFLRTLIEGMDIDAEVTVREPETAADGEGRASAVLDIEGEDLGLLIGRRGTTLAALQYMVNVMLTRKMDSRVIVTVDVEHYHRRREETLQGLAQRMADRVSNSRRPMTLEPMPANERRIIHLALSEDEDVVTGSVGQGDERKVVIRPRGGGGGRGGGDRYNR
ncbi:MAG TPA: RNA-binding cell elongation regulator Jag/EloR [Dehalococcoidia bacterium]